MTSPTTGTTVDVRVGDRIQVLAAKATSAHTFNVLTRGFVLDVTYARAQHDGTVEVNGILLTARGAWRAGAPSRSVILTADSFTPAIRVGDTIRYPRTGETGVVTAIHERPDGTALADLLFNSGTTGSGYNLVDLEHAARPTVLPTTQPCLRRHDPAIPCARCAEATTPVTTTCDALSCSRPATTVVIWSPRPGTRYAKAFCPVDTETHLASLNPPAQQSRWLVAVAAGTYTLLADGSGTQVATCEHCGHAIYLYPANAGRSPSWRGGEFDETGRCAIEVEQRAGQPVRHEPAITLAQRDFAHAAATCGTTQNQHSLADCPVRQ